MSAFIVTKSLDGSYVFNLCADNQEVVLSSDQYAARVGCLHGVDAARAHAQDKERFKRKITAEGSYYFVLTAANGRVVGISEMYGNISHCEEGIAAVMDAAREADVYEQLG